MKKTILKAHASGIGDMRPLGKGWVLNGLMCLRINEFMSCCRNSSVVEALPLMFCFTKWGPLHVLMQPGGHHQTLVPLSSLSKPSSNGKWTMAPCYWVSLLWGQSWWSFCNQALHRSQSNLQAHDQCSTAAVAERRWWSGLVSPFYIPHRPPAWSQCLHILPDRLLE